jgi:LPXTG-motif cell wall-anchored protein
LCPDGVCPPPPDCAPPPVDALILFAIGGGDPSDNQACVSTEVTSVGGETVGPDIPATPDGTGDEGGGLPFTGSSTLPPLVAGACVFAGLSLLGAARRRRRMRSA